VIPENIIDKYVKVWTLADSGAPEAHAARKIMQTMEHKYPGIRQQAQALKRAMNPTPPPPEPESRPWEDVYADQQRRKEWEQSRARQQPQSDWRTMATSAFNYASQYAYQAFGAMEADNIAERVRIESRNNSGGSLSVIARFDPNVLNYAQHLTAVQKEMISSLVAARVKEELMFRLNE